MLLVHTTEFVPGCHRSSQLQLGDCGPGSKELVGSLKNKKLRATALRPKKNHNLFHKEGKLAPDRQALH